jgi:hypothetical protein
MPLPGCSTRSELLSVDRNTRIFLQDDEPEWVVRKLIFADSLLTANNLLTLRLPKGHILLFNEGAVHCSRLWIECGAFELQGFRTPRAESSGSVDI